MTEVAAAGNKSRSRTQPLELVRMTRTALTSEFVADALHVADEDTASIGA